MLEHGVLCKQVPELHNIRYLNIRSYGNARLAQIAAMYSPADNSSLAAVAIALYALMVGCPVKKNFLHLVRTVIHITLWHLLLNLVLVLQVVAKAGGAIVERQLGVFVVHLALFADYFAFVIGVFDKVLPNPARCHGTSVQKNTEDNRGKKI